MKRIKIQRLRGAWGYYSTNGQIILSNRLKDIPVPSKAMVHHHEEFHKYIQEKGLILPEKSEELKCHIYGLMQCKDFELSDLESLLKKYIISKHGKLGKKDILEMDEFI